MMEKKLAWGIWDLPLNQFYHFLRGRLNTIIMNYHLNHWSNHVHLHPNSWDNMGPRKQIRSNGPLIKFYAVLKWFLSKAVYVDHFALLNKFNGLSKDFRNDKSKVANINSKKTPPFSGRFGPVALTLC